MSAGPTIQHDDAVRILRSIDTGDPLGMADHVVVREDDDPAEEVIHVARLMLAGRIAVPDAAEISYVDPITAHLIAWQGADPLAAAAICHVARGIGIVDVNGDKIATLMHSAPLTMVHADPLRWHSIPGHLRVPTLPETVVAALAGRRLADVLSHPALDRLPIIINSAQPDDDGPWMILHLNPGDPEVLLGRERLAEVGRMYRTA